MLLTSKGGNRVTPDSDAGDESADGIPTSKGGITEEQNALANGTVANINYQVASIYECDNKEQLTKYYHASLGSHPKTTLIAAAKSGFLRGCPGFNAKAISKFIGVEEATEMGHMRQLQKGKGSTTTKSKRGRPKKDIDAIERSAAIDDSIALPLQEPGNEKTNLVFMTVQHAEGFISSDQTGKFPRISNKGNYYICVFYIYDPNFIKSIPIESRKKEDLLKAYQEVYKWCEQRGFKPKLARWTTKCQRTSKTSSQANKQTSNTPHRTCIEQTPRRKHYKRTNIASNQQLLLSHQTFLFHIGADYFRK